MMPLERDCYRVIAYFALFRYPVTAFEVWKWLYAPSSPWTLADVMTSLRTSAWLQARVRERNGFYGIGDLDADVRDRHERFLDALRKYRRVQQVAQYVGRLPHVQGVAVCNSLALHHTNHESDIDLFIITEPRRVWTVRFFAVAAMALLRIRPGETVRDPVCCSFFVDHDLLAMEGLKIGDDDPYLAMWHATLAPIVDHTHVFARLRAENSWVRAVLPHAYAVRRAAAYRPRMTVRLPVSPIAEAAARAFQERRLTPVIAERKNRDTRVIVNNKMLKFHENDRREAIATQLNEKLSAL